MCGGECEASIVDCARPTRWAVTTVSLGVLHLCDRHAAVWRQRRFPTVELPAR